MDTIYDAKLLIVDDNTELLALLCEQLCGAGYSERCSWKHKLLQNGKAAWQQAALPFCAVFR